MNVLVVSHACATRINQQIYAEIHKRTGWQFTLVVPKGWRDEFGNFLEASLWDEFEAELIQFPVLFNGKIVTHCYRGSFSSLIRKQSIDVVYVNHEPYAIATWQVACACVRKKIPFGVYSCQNIAKTYPPPFSWMEHFVYRHAKFAFPITQAVADVMKTKGFEGSLTVAPLPLDPERYRPNKKSETPEIISRKEPSFLIGYVGRMIEAKGLKTLAKALIAIKELDWNLILIGKGDYLQDFKLTLGNAGLERRLIETGYVPHEETPRYLAAMDLLVLPSETQPNWKEQFGRVIPEAMACGTPVVGSDSGEIPNLIKRSRGGLVFPEKDSIQLSQCVRSMMSDESLHSKCATKGRAWVEANISLTAVADCMIRTMQSSKIK